jgi:ketosteroid isomerase-like protein
VSQENVKIMRQVTAEVEDRGLQAAYAFLDPDVEWVVAREHPDARVLAGREAVAEYQREWEETLPNMRFEIERLLDAGERIVGIGSVRGTGKGSGADVGVEIALVYTLSHGLIVRVEEYLRTGDALKAVGLEE